MAGELMDLIVSVLFVGFGILLVAFIFIKSYIDNKKEKKIVTEIFLKYGVKTTAKIEQFRENSTYGRFGIVGKYNYYISFEYKSVKADDICTQYTLPTNNPKSKEYLENEEIPIIFIPAYLDYQKGLISKGEFFGSIGRKIRLASDVWLVIFADDLSFITNLNEF